MKLFDLHIDAVAMTPEFEKFLTVDSGFWRNDFCGHPAGQARHEPKHHLTLQLETGREFRGIFEKVVGYARRYRLGYPRLGFI